MCRENERCEWRALVFGRKDAGGKKGEERETWRMNSAKKSCKFPQLLLCCCWCWCCTRKPHHMWRRKSESEWAKEVRVSTRRVSVEDHRSHTCVALFLFSLHVSMCMWRKKVLTQTMCVRSTRNVLCMNITKDPFPPLYITCRLGMNKLCCFPLFVHHWSVEKELLYNCE